MLNLFKIFAQLSLDSSGYDKGIDDAESKAQSFGKALKSGLGAAAKIGAAAVTAAATGVAALTKQAIDSYADYEQLAGGIETLFGTGGKTLEEYAASVGKTTSEARKEFNKQLAAERLVMQNAEKAYATAGMSMNEYMETAIQSGAALISSLEGDQKKAAKLIDVSITDMADNVNKMGTTMEAVQNAYRGFSRGNFTMLDNLALGYAGTKEGMEELLADAEAIAAKEGRIVDYSIENYADIINAIHDVQTEMGITGTTQREAADTISGSMATLRSAWANLLTDVANGEKDIGPAVQNVVASAKNVLKNLLPVIKESLKGIGQAVKEFAPIIREELPGFVKDVLPDLIDAAIELAIVLGQALAENAPEIITTLVSAIVQNTPKLVEAGLQIVGTLVIGLVQAIPQLLWGAVQLMAGLIEGIYNGVSEMFTAGGELVWGLWDGISDNAWAFMDKVEEWLGSVWDGILGFFGIASPSKEMAWVGEMLGEGLANGIGDSAKDAIRAAEEMSAGILDAVSGQETGSYDLTASNVSKRQVVHSGTIRIEGVSDDGQFNAAVDVIYENLVAQLRRETRFA